MKGTMKKMVSASLAGLLSVMMSVTGVLPAYADTEVTEGRETVEVNETVESVGVQENSGTTGGGTLSYNGYTLQWEDDFDGDGLNTDDWNYEIHEPGWVNNELQEYVVSDENVYIENGKLVIKPVKETKDGKVSYTSGRINTQGKHDFTYGLFEVRAKVPSGKGFLPAFWMMPTDEGLYGQWPRCGEIDIMEVLGNDVETAYGTIHYGNPHKESQGKYELKGSSGFSDEFHTFACEWEPGKIKWYVDGNLFHEESDWYSRTEGQGEITYPAPFDQPYYMILNLAVGGNWPGNPDGTTDFENAAFVIDYVKAYQKDSYDEDVEKPVKEIVFRQPDVSGNYVHNGSFATAETLDDTEDWQFGTQLGGQAQASISENAITIVMQNAGTEDYSVQLMQAGIPVEKADKYEVSFDACAESERTMKVGISAPDNGWIRYLPDTVVELTNQMKTYTYTFTMEKDSDANGRLEFNLGNTDPISKVTIKNVKVVKTEDNTPAEDSSKTVLADGNHVYNGSFQEGADRKAYWEIANPCSAEISVTGLGDGRRLKVVVPDSVTPETAVTVLQNGLAINGAKEYALSYLAEAASVKNIGVSVAGETKTVGLAAEKRTYSDVITTDGNLADADKRIVFIFAEPGTYYLDDVRLVENSLIKNGNFSAGFAGWETYVDSSASATSVVDSLSEENAADFTISNTGDQDWKVQLKQSNVKLEKTQWYKLSFDIKSSLERKISYAIQRDGSKHKDADGNEDWTPYVQNIVNLPVSEEGEYEKITVEFQMTEETDEGSIFNIAMGAVGSVAITSQHRICIDNVCLEKIDQPEIPSEPFGVNLLKNADFSKGMENWTETIANWEGGPGADAVSTITDGRISYNITDPGTEDWNVQLKQSGLNLEAGCEYKVSFKASSTVARTMKVAVMSKQYDWYGGADIDLPQGSERNVECTFTMNGGDAEADIVFSMGKIEGVETPASVIILSGFSVVKVDKSKPAQGGNTGNDQPQTPPQTPKPIGTVVKTETASYKVAGTAGAAEVQFVGTLTKTAKSVTIPDTIKADGISYKVTSIADNAFKGSKKLTSVKLGSNITTIGKNAFSGCVKLKTVKLNAGLQVIDNGAFSGCSALKSLTVPGGVNTIGAKAFNNCKNLKKITIKSTELKKVGAKAFKGINAKATIKVPKKQLKTYQKLLKGKGQAKTVKIKK